MEHIRTAQTAIPETTEVSRVLRNTYLLLSMTLAFSALTAGIAMAANMSHGAGLIMSLVAIALVWFVLPRTANSSAGLVVVFAFTGLIGASLGPMLNYYLALANGTSIVLQALGGTAFAFLGLSGYALVTRKDFSFLQGFVVMGVMVMIGAMLLLMGASLFGYHLEMLSLAFSAGVIILMSAIILFQTSNIIHGGERNYIMATTSLYLAIINIFTSLLHLLGAGED
ncbi:Bax inhibitor-1/YccA family protein [Gilvimarinus agarilyticus]|uniref:Bax inhibitor-1/YccA family protein n=1 Tax=unclassified Gilvimarinus TaxID=2642066 RepID=UPI001C098891|nr:MULTISPECIES: Bax inhibitor-1/YccA family protein [unclassified Gilvimarinus]MBU2887037.1 Bax inhibitor-1/YccA family protein [Gilvimarinus agarilyticus]MDO6571697.1 Bax inhibitor-1/YccA family protein [Gilvimarinus sp. 2_MG-2023]MDO6745769.1 Bax inhibitor-1/YccA family protein [Gilvimarinus sp. 1_MG-2023]